MGSSKRDKTITTSFLEQDFIIERKGTDGDLEKLHQWVKKEDGKANVITLGGLHKNLVLLNRSYPFRAAKKMERAAKITPVIDGELFREVAEPYFIRKLVEKKEIDPKQTVLFPLVTNRLAVADEFFKSGFSNIVYGDLIYDLGIPRLAIRSLRTINLLSNIVAPIVTNVPYTWIYPTGSKQEQIIIRSPELFQEAEIITGDFHNIRRFLIDDLTGKTIITNTVTSDDRKLLKERKLTKLITFTPSFDGRSFGANLINGVIISLLNKEPDKISKREYLEMVDKLGLEPEVNLIN